jgi:hypothetical protein
VRGRVSTGRRGRVSTDRRAAWDDHGMTGDEQAIRPNTWTPLFGTDVEILIDGVAGNVRVEAEQYRNARGETLAQFTLALDTGQSIAVRAPAEVLTWTDNPPE